ncbi:unnamed protein product, partial [marine sediment metagenome]
DLLDFHNLNFYIYTRGRQRDRGKKKGTEEKGTKKKGTGYFLY